MSAVKEFISGSVYFGVVISDSGSDCAFGHVSDSV